jgi:hypothetical protein
VGKKWLKDPNSPRRVLADSSNAKHRFGFSGDRGSPILEAPKLSDLWFIEYKPVTDGSTSDTSRISALAKTVSPISISTATMPIDAYGKRIYVPTRVDFPEVSLTMYDDISGKMFDFVADIYGKFFDNNVMGDVTGANAEYVLTGVGNHGRRLPGQEHEYYHQHFEKLTIYHFFGNLDKVEGNPHLRDNNTGTGTLQKIELINPLVTGITFSGSDYSTTELRTVDLQLQPENVIIGKPTDVAFPDWMTLGMDYMMDALSPIHLRHKHDTYPTEFKDKMFDIAPKTDEELKKQELKKEEQEDRDTERKLNELMQLYNAQIQNPNEQGNEALAAALKSRIGVLNAARAKRFYTGDQKKYVDKFNTRDESTYSATYLNPDVPTFGGVGDSNPPKNQYPNQILDMTNNLSDAMVQELVSSTFGNRSFNTNNVFDLKSQLAGIAQNINSSMTSHLTVDGATALNSAVQANSGAFATVTQAFKERTNENSTTYYTGEQDGVSKIIKTRVIKK